MPTTFDGPGGSSSHPAQNRQLKRPHRPPRAGWPGHAARWPGTPVTGPTPTGGAFVSGCASAAARSPASRSTRGARSSTSQQHDASKSAGATGAARLNHASSTALDRGATPTSTTRARPPPAAAAARRRAPAPDNSGNQADPAAARSMMISAHQGPTALAVHAGPAVVLTWLYN